MTDSADAVTATFTVDGHDVTLAVAGLSDRRTIENLMQLYLYDFTEYTGDDPDAHGLFHDEYLHLYWTEQGKAEGRVPYLVRVDGAPAGFVLVKNPHAPVFGTDHDIGEFFIMRRWRRHGIGGAVARAVFGLHCGAWEVRVMRENAPALAFWRRTINAYTGGRYQEIDSRSEYWDGTVFVFHAPFGTL